MLCNRNTLFYKIAAQRRLLGIWIFNHHIIGNLMAECSGEEIVKIGQ